MLVLASQAQAHRPDVRTRARVYEPHIARAAARYGVEPRLLWAIAFLESRFNPRAVSRKGARGLMQFVPSTGRRYGLKTVRELHDPALSIDAAARYVRDLSAMFGGKIDLVLAAYNAGEHAVIHAGYGVPRYRETRGYVARGLSIMTSLEQEQMLASVPNSGENPFLLVRNINNRPALSRETGSRSNRSHSIYFSEFHR